MNNSINIAVIGLGQIGIYLLNELNTKKKRLKLITIVNQFFPPDFAATGQLLNELSEGLSRESDFNIKILTGWPSYAYKSEPKYKTEKFPSRTIVRSNTSRIWPKKLGGRIVNSLFFVFSADILAERRVCSAFATFLRLRARICLTDFLAFC